MTSLLLWTMGDVQPAVGVWLGLSALTDAVDGEALPQRLFFPAALGGRGQSSVALIGRGGH